MPENGKKKTAPEDLEADALLKGKEKGYSGPMNSYRDSLSAEETKRPNYKDGSVLVSASPEGKILCPKVFFATKQKGEEGNVIDMSLCTNPRCQYWRGYGRNGRRTVITPDQKAKEEALLTVECAYRFEDQDERDSYCMIMEVLADVPLEKMESLKKSGIDLKEMIDDVVKKSSSSG